MNQRLRLSMESLEPRYRNGDHDAKSADSLCRRPVLPLLISHGADSLRDMQDSPPSNRLAWLTASVCTA